MTSIRQGLISALLFLSYASFCPAQTPVAISPLPQLQFFDQNGVPLAFGCIFTYQSGTTTPLTTYTEYTGTYQNQNPVILSPAGTANIWIQTGQAYRFVGKSTGGTNCSLGTLIFTVDGIGGSGTQLTTAVTPSGGSATFIDQAQNQLFTLTLTGNVTSLPMTAAGIISPGIVTFEILQDGAGSHTFSWPSNVLYAANVCSVANCLTQQSFIWNGTNAIPLGSATFSTPAYVAPNIFDQGLSASSALCSSSTLELVSSCNSIYAITFNGQTVNPAGSGNVNPGNATHSFALNEGNGNPLGALAAGANQIPVGQAGADPVASTLPTCSTGQALTFTGSLPLTCLGANVSVLIYARQELSGDVSVSASTSTTLTSKAITMPSTGCPCRAEIAWNIGIQTGSAGGFSAAVNDGTNTFAFGQGNASGSVGGNAQIGIQATGWSHATYANNANVTFTLKTEGVDTGYTVKQGASEGIVQNSGMDITIFSSN